MNLTKGYLSKQNPFQLKHILIGISCWIAFAYILYAFFYIFREIIRYLTLGDDLSGNTLLILNAEEHYIYNLFFAAIASALGYMLAFRFTLGYFFFINQNKTRLNVRQLSNSQSFNFWVFLFWFGKVGSFLAIWYLIYPLQYDIDFIQEFPELLLLIPIVLFIFTFQGIRKLVGNNWKQWMLITTSIFVSMSFLFSFKDFINVETINYNLKNLIIEEAYDLQLPESTTHNRIQRCYLASNLYVVRDSVDKKKPLLFINSIFQPTTFSRLSVDLKSEQGRLSEHERDKLFVNIMMDSSLSINYLSPIKDELRKLGIRSIQYSTGLLNSKYPSDYPYFKYWGIQQVLPLYSPKLKSFLDSAENIDLTKYKITLPDSYLYRNESILKTNRVKITVDEQHVYLNNQLVSPDQLRNVLYHLIKKYNPDFKVIYEPNPQISYGRYIRYLDLIISVNAQLRNEMSMQHYGEPFDPLAYDRDNTIITDQYPDILVEWTAEEKRLNQLMEKTKRQKEK